MSKIDTAVIDYGMGNLRSVAKALEHVAPGKNIVITSNPDEVMQAERVVFPGQGAMPDCMRELDARGLRDVVLEAANTKPFLGICIGLQMLFESSEEGNAKGLGFLKGHVKRFANELKSNEGEKLKVPHMGWNQVYQHNPTHPMWQGIPNGERFYYVHSYYVQADDHAIDSAYSQYPQQFTSVIATKNVFAVQFHPEKSAAAGLQLLTNFVNWKP